MLRVLSKYTILTCVILGIDLATVFLVRHFLDTPLSVATASGLVTGSVSGYFLHLKYTFRHLALTPSGKGLFKYLQSCGIGAVARLASLALFQHLTDFPEFICLFISIGISFVTNFALSKYYVYKPE